MLKELIIRMAGEFSLNEEESKKIGSEVDVEQETIDKLDRGAKFDEIDTVTFGLETDDGMVVKVYVKADQADDFEKAMANKLGEVDDIEEALNELSKEFEIVDVEWPEDKSQKNSSGLDTDGSEVMNKEVYDNPSEKSSGGKTKWTAKESLSFGEQAALAFLGEDESIEQRFTTSSQMMVFHAIIELGVPEEALIRNPLRSTIIKGIKEKALEISKNPSMKTALKQFINKSIDYDKNAGKKETDDEGLEEALTIKESLASDYWEVVINLIKYIGAEEDETTQLLSSSALKNLISSSSSPLQQNVSSEFRSKMDDLQTALDKANDSAEATAAGISESATPAEIITLLQALFTMADSDAGTLSKQILASAVFKTWINSSNSTLSQKFDGPLRTKLNDLQSVMKQSAADKATNSSTTAPTTESLLKEDGEEWQYGTNGENITMKCQALTIELDPESAEKVIKGISNRETVTVPQASENSKKVIFSPRGVRLLVKVIGNQASMTLSSDQVDDLLDHFQSQGK
jgi:hypothetical protein